MAQDPIPQEAAPEADPPLPVRPQPGDIVLAGASLAYDGRPLFDGLELRAAAGRTTAILGPSGVGKSSLLRLIAGLLPAPAGRASDGAGAPLSGRIAWMAQSDLLLPWLGVRENVMLGARLRGEPADPARAMALLTRVGLAERAQARPAALSGGMRQRAALARTLMENRPFVLMDEPFSALDALTRLRLQDLAADLLAGRTVLLVTHDPTEALRLADAVHVMHGVPARIGPALPCALPRPRDPAAPAFRRLYAELFARLREAGAAA